MIAVKKGMVNMTRLLLQAGASVNAYRGSTKERVFETAQRLGNRDLIDALLNYNPDSGVEKQEDPYSCRNPVYVHNHHSYVLSKRQIEFLKEVRSAPRCEQRQKYYLEKWSPTWKHLALRRTKGMMVRDRG
ncbi:uncharacterized protein BDZ99DRAFT_422691 [Mytilinidion resinicola]|uniref:Ankyrin n=1 Tax=Mytilinidion resinicola TaxID=574789 RepID=A0A6A6YC35_9PEZI|nr:uncharacterized protein BDZ99DRAFT_422691 [Mytilinidion resinicola]KAF2806270.1 hypothetical protein BDZ99DRAFT_422691 [Mytilinidion resinicola]